VVIYDVTEDSILNVNKSEITIKKGKNYFIENVNTIYYLDKKLKNIDTLKKEIFILE
jgi:hypothetical protein